MLAVCFGGSEEKKADSLLESVHPNRDSAKDTTSEEAEIMRIEGEQTGEKVLLEIVGAMGLSAIKDCTSSFCTVSVDKNKVHNTSVIHNDTSPIWTVASKSLCLLNLEDGNTVTVDLKSSNLIGFASAKILCSVTLNFGALKAGDGKRVEYKLKPQNDGRALITLALRFRPALQNDLNYFSQATSIMSHNLRAADVDFKNVSQKNMFQKQVKGQQSIFYAGKREKKYRVWPGPDPDNPTRTEFMTKQAIKDVALLPSKQWSEIGHGRHGSLHLEIISCNDLPNMDIQLIEGLTDSFVSLVFEDSHVRSSIIYDSLSPRWMPWSNRAYKFNIAHPSSILFLGVFDYDEGPINHHDPISRIEIHPSSFEHDTVYTLTYPLYLGGGYDEYKSTITVRLRVHWNDPAEIITELSFGSPPFFYVNVETEKSWKVIRYLTRGSIDLQEVSVPCLKSYVQELLGHWKQYCYLLDIFAEIILWRGRINLVVDDSKFSLWCPVHSIFLFASITFAMERPDMLPTIISFVIAYGLLCNNYHLSTHPNPWRRVKPFRRFTNIKTNESQTKPLYIEPGNVNEVAEQQLELLDEYRAHRTTAFLYDFVMAGLSVYKVYNKSLPLDFSTVKSKDTLLSSLYSDYLSYAISLVRVMCKKIRLVRNFVNWKSHSTYRYTMALLLVGTFWLLFPNKGLFFAAFKVFVWLMFGPHLMLLDVFLIRKYYRTKEQLFKDGLPTSTEAMKEEIAQRPNIMEPLLTSSWLRQMVKSGRVVAEHSIKLRDFRKEKYGKFSEHIHYQPNIHPSIPLYSSFAQPYANECDPAAGDDYFKDLPEEKLSWTFIPGQKLDGVMIPQATVQPRVGPAKKNN